MARGDLTDIEWQRLEPILPPASAKRRGGQFKDHRTVINGILWVMRTGAPWRDLPERYGPWQSCYSRFSRWSRTGIWQKIAITLHAAGEDALENSDLLRESHRLPPAETPDNEPLLIAAGTRGGPPVSAAAAAAAAPSSGGIYEAAALPSPLRSSDHDLPSRPAWLRGTKLSVLEMRRK